MKDPVAAGRNAYAVSDLVSSHPYDSLSIEENGPAGAQEARHFAICEVVGQWLAMSIQPEGLKSQARTRRTESELPNRVGVDVRLPP